MSEHANKREKRLAMLVVAAVVLVTVLLIVETFRLLLPGLWSAFSAGDEQALSEYLASQGRLRSFLTLWFLAVVQVLSLVIPAMPVQLAAGLAYGPWMGWWILTREPRVTPILQIRQQPVFTGTITNQAKL